MADGVAYTVVHNIWSAAVRDFYNQVAPTVKPTKVEALAKSAISLSLDERKALATALTATIPVEAQS